MTSTEITGGGDNLDRLGALRGKQTCRKCTADYQHKPECQLRNADRAACRIAEGRCCF